MMIRPTLAPVLFFISTVLILVHPSQCQEQAETNVSSPVTQATAALTISLSTNEDWPMYGGTPGRNMVSSVKPISIDFQLEEFGKNLLWSANLGSQTYGNAIVSNGKVFVGTNNGAGLRPKHPGDQDKGVLACFDAESGKFLWQLTCEKLAEGKAVDWPLQGICSSPVVEGDRLWVVTNRCELLCLDVNGFADGKNDGAVTDEVDNEPGDADIIWRYDMIKEMNVFPHNLATASPVIHEDAVFILTSNGVDESGTNIPSPEAPSFVAFEKSTGKLLWKKNDPGKKIMDGQWGSPAVGIVNGKAQVYFPGGDGWLYAYDARSGDEVWRFDMNPKKSEWLGGGRGERSYMVATPVFIDNSVLLAVGQDPENGDGVGHLYRIDATKTGDISPELGEWGSEGKPNPNSGVLWHYGGTKDDKELIFRRTISSVSVADGMVFCADLAGFVHCVDFATGKRHWEHDMLAQVWGSTVVADGKVFLGNQDGNLVVIEAKKERATVLAEIPTAGFSSIYSTPTFANGKMYLTDRVKLYCVDVSGK